MTRVKPEPGHYKIVFPGAKVLYLHVDAEGASIVLDPIHYVWEWVEHPNGPYLAPEPGNPDQAHYAFTDTGEAILIHGDKSAVGGYERI